jgi:rare lipoprotein A
VVAEGEPASEDGGYQIGKPYVIAGKWYEPKEDPDYDEEGVASWYGKAFHGRLTANGEVFDVADLSAAHPTLPLPSYVRVTNLENERSVVVRVNDRGPFKHGRLIDVSERAAHLLGFRHRGMARVRVEYVDKAPLEGEDEEVLLASYRGPAVDDAPSGVMLAAAEPRRPDARAVESIVLASVPANTVRVPVERPATSAVAFASAPTAAAAALGAVDVLTTTQSAAQRIDVAFQLVSEIE